MNTVKSFWVGWGALCVAGGGAYFFAKKSINADRQARFEAEQRRRRMQESLEYSAAVPSQPVTSSSMGGSAKTGNGGPARSDHSGSPSQEATLDPAPTRHAPDTEGQRVREKSKYEASEPFRAKKGDRFS
ncbi:hypothetical protein EG329_006155 [Mollisiaceae sp. DMI_Dod_QoI]|nr:hypothetical protein EG329_006155 [Helotiales sp. DMI_Dod_QoI]